MKKFLVLVFSLLFLVNFLNVNEVFADEYFEKNKDSKELTNTVKTPDSPSYWAVNFINEFTDKGLMPDEFAFNYQSNITRRDFCELAVYVYAKSKGYADLDELLNGELKEEFTAYSYPFKDLREDDKYIFAANILGFVNGVSASEFAPEKELTREQAAKILFSFYSVLSKAGYEQVPWNSFDDDEQIALWAKLDVYRIRHLGIMSGVGENKFAPKDKYTKEQSIITLLKALDACESYAKAQDIKEENYKKEVIRLINVERAKAGVAALTECSECNEYADVRAKEIEESFSHTRPNGKALFEEVPEYYSGLGENIACGGYTPEKVMEQWMNSPGHKANILNPSFEQVSVGYYYDSNSIFHHYWVQAFTAR